MSNNSKNDIHLGSAWSSRTRDRSARRFRCKVAESLLTQPVPNSSVGQMHQPSCCGAFMSFKNRREEWRYPPACLDELLVHVRSHKNPWSYLSSCLSLLPLLFPQLLLHWSLSSRVGDWWVSKQLYFGICLFRPWRGPSVWVWVSRSPVAGTPLPSPQTHKPALHPRTLSHPHGAFTAGGAEGNSAFRGGFL